MTTVSKYETIQLTKDQKKKLEASIKDVSNLMFQQETIRTQIAESRKYIKDEFGINPKTFNMLTRMYHKDQRDKLEEESMEVIDLYDSLFKSDDN